VSKREVWRPLGDRMLFFSNAFSRRRYSSGKATFNGLAGEGGAELIMLGTMVEVEWSAEGGLRWSILELLPRESGRSVLTRSPETG